TGNAAEWKQRAAARPHASQGHVTQVSPVVGFFIFLVVGGMFLLFFGVSGYIILGSIINGLVAIHVLPQHKDRQGWWHWLDFFDDGKPFVRRSGSSRVAWATGSSSWSDSSSSSSSSDSFSGGGGDSGGGGASGSW